MSCGCAGRMRAYVLPRFGYQYERIGERWVHPSEPPIPDAEVGLHYTRVMMVLVAREGEKAIKAWLDPIVKRGE